MKAIVQSYTFKLSSLILGINEVKLLLLGSIINKYRPLPLRYKEF